MAARATGSRHLDIVEPTLSTEAGHCAVVLRSLKAAAPDLGVTVWGAVGCGALFGDLAATVQIKPWFRRRWRKLQALLLYRRLLRSGAALLVPTAGRFDLEAVARVAPRRIAPDRVFLYFHRLALTPAKSRALRRIAARQPDLVTIGTTDAITARLRDLGFRATGTMLPLPPLRPPAPGPLAPFRHVVVAGAARADKGIDYAVDLVELLAQRGIRLPVALQISGDHYARHDAVARAALEKLRRIDAPDVTTVPETLDADAFTGLMRGAICLQPYRRADYADKISGITLDALAASAPIVTVDGTWMATIVRRYRCGEIAAGLEPEALLAAIERVRADFTTYSERAREAAAHLAATETWQPLLSRLLRA